jgi:5-hydroxyisourate hydrolase-like protein (transthyretin family)
VIKKTLLWLATAVLALVLAGCGGGGGGAGTPVGQTSGSSGSGNSATVSSVSVSLSSSTVTPAVEGIATIAVRDSSGRPLSGKLVTLALSGNTATIPVDSVVTGSDGTAQVRLIAVTTGLSGGNQLTATVASGTTSVSGNAAFAVSGSAPTLSIQLSTNTISTSGGGAVVQATVRDATGAVIPNSVLAFSAANGNVKFSATSAMTATNGVATVTVTPVSAGLNAADQIIATGSVGTQSIRGVVAVQLIADQPRLAVSLSNSAVSLESPSTVSATLLQTDGSPASGVLVNFAAANSLVSFDRTSAMTNADGVATVTVSPATSTSNGADEIKAAATVGGVALTKTSILQVNSQFLAAAPRLDLAISPQGTITSASSATATATLKTAAGQGISGQVVAFSVVRDLGKVSVATALTDANGVASVLLTPKSSTVAGADEVKVTAQYAGTSLEATRGFQIQATAVSLTSLVADVAPQSLSPYGQTALTLSLAGAAAGSPVNIALSSTCVALGKATLSPASFTATTSTVSMQYKDAGCGAVLPTGDKIVASIVGGTSSAALELPISAPAVSSIGFVSASPEVIYTRGTGLAESSVVVFEVKDAAGNVLPNRLVTLRLLTESGGITIQGATRASSSGMLEIQQRSDASGRVTALVIAGTQPTPIRISASLFDDAAARTVTTVSSGLSVAVGLPSQLNFSISQLAHNIEGMDRDGATNSIAVYAADRSGNPVPNGTSINFVTEGGQIESVRQTAISAGVAFASARFVSQSPRPDDGRVTITAYTLGEESFIDLNGNNVWDADEPFQDLGDIFKDRNFDGVFDPLLEEYVSTGISNSSSCGSFAATVATTASNSLMRLDASTPSRGGLTCDNTWSGAGRVYVRRAIETVLSTSASRLMWADSAAPMLGSSCRKVLLQTGNAISDTKQFAEVQDSVVALGSARSVRFYLSDANTYPTGSYLKAHNSQLVGRFNPIAAGSKLTASTPTAGVALKVEEGGTTPSTTEPSYATVTIDFGSAQSAVIALNVSAPSGLVTTTTFTASIAAQPNGCFP